MRQMTALAALAVLVMGSLAAVPNVSEAARRQQFAQGSGTVVPGPVRFQFVAHSGPDGENARGHMRVTDPSGAEIVSKVTCLTVVGNRAMIGSEVTKSNVPGQPVGSGGFLWVEDDGQPGQGQAVNLFDGQGALPSSPPVCPPTPKTQQALRRTDPRQWRDSVAFHATSRDGLTLRRIGAARRPASAGLLCLDPRALTSWIRPGFPATASATRRSQSSGEVSGERPGLATPGSQTAPGCR